MLEADVFVVFEHEESLERGHHRPGVELTVTEEVRQERRLDRRPEHCGVAQEPPVLGPDAIDPGTDDGFDGRRQ